MERVGGIVGGAPVYVLQEGDTLETYTKAQRGYREALVTKWAWLLEGTREMKKTLPPLEEDMYEPLAMMLENQQAVHLGILEATQTTDLVIPQTYSYPIIRKMFPQMWAWRVASIQPMPLSSGGVATFFYMDFEREDVTPNQSTTIPSSDYPINVENGVPKRLKMTMTSAQVTATKDILGASWSSEVQEDARGTLGIDVQFEMTNEMAKDITRSIDYRICLHMLNGATGTAETWDATVPAGYKAKEWYETLAHKIIAVEDGFFGTEYGARGDYIVCGRVPLKYIRMMQNFVPTPRNQPGGPLGNWKMGVNYVGSIEGFWDVYETNLTAFNNTILVGCYPSSKINASYIYGPYIPLTPMPLVYAEFKPYDDATLPGAYVNVDKWSRNVRTRNARKLAIPELFGTVTVSE